MPLCCGKTRKSNYCPDCGDKLCNKTPAAELLEYCRAREKANRNAATDRTARMRSADDVTREEFRNLAEASTEIADQWKTWGDALAALIENANAKPTPAISVAKAPAR